MPDCLTFFKDFPIGAPSGRGRTSFLREILLFFHEIFSKMASLIFLGSLMEYQAIIVGAGPAGIFSALTLMEKGIDGILLLEQGKGIRERTSSPSREILCGWGGAGAYSDGKLTFSPDVGGYLGEYMSPASFRDLLSRTDGVFLRYGAPRERLFGDFSPEVEALVERARRAELEFIPNRIRHMGTENCRTVLCNLYDDLKDRIEIRTDCRAEAVLAGEGLARGVRLEDGSVERGRFVIAAPGRSGSRWMKDQAEALGLQTSVSPVDIGVRVELPAAFLNEITDLTYESKLVYYSRTFDDRVRTFCMNPGGEVVNERSGDLITVNGHSFANRKSKNTNFAILVSSMFTEPFRDPIAYGRYIAQLANLLSGGTIVQRLGDLLAGRRSTRARIDRCLTTPTLKQAVPGDLSYVFPYRHLRDIIEMIEAMDRLAPGVSSRHTLLYGVEVKFYSNRIEVTEELETGVKNLFAVGDGAGLTRGLLQAAASGIVAAEAVADRLHHEPHDP